MAKFAVKFLEGKRTFKKTLSARSYGDLNRVYEDKDIAFDEILSVRKKRK